MKYFVAIFLFAFVAGIRAEEFDDFLLEDEIDGGDPDRHPYVQCKIDLYDCLKQDKVGNIECLKTYKTCMAQMIPPFVIACKNELKQCTSSASGFLEKGKCFIAFAKCLKNKGPTGGAAVLDMGQLNDDTDPDRHPYVQCKIDMYDCVRLGKESKVQCLKNYKTCMAQLLPTVPPFVIACRADLKQCLDASSGFLAKAKCFKALGRCLINGPTIAPAHALMDEIEDPGQMEDMSGILQCKKDLYNCFKDGKDKSGCFKDYKVCMEAQIQYVKQCYAKAKKCFANASGLKDRYTCTKELGICLINGAPSQAPPVPSAS